MAGKNENSDIIHDFLHERLIFKVFGGFYVVQKPMSHYVINVLLIACVFIMLIFLFLLGIYTFIVSANNASLKIQILLMLIFMPIAVVVPAIRYCYRRNFNIALKLLKSGIDQYSSELPDKEHTIIKKKRVEQVRLWSFIFGILCCFSAISNTVQSPVMQLISSEKNTSNSAINLYLPLPLAMPFDTRTYHGYIIAFLSNTIYLFIMYTALFCFTESYLSSSLQLLAQLEILNYSLSNIEKRAALKLKEGQQFITRSQNAGIFESMEFQKNLYLCLRTNIQHHQTIVRFAQEVKEYLGAMNTLNLVNFGLIFATSVVPVVKDPVNNFALSLAVLSLEMTGYLQLFWVGQIISDTSADTMNVLYSTPWTHCNKSYNISLNVMMTSAKKQIVLRSPSFNSEWTLETFGVMLSGAYKLVNLLLNTT